MELRETPAFSTTHWSIIDALGHDDAEIRSAAEQALCQTYWPAVHAFLRARGHGPDDAAELTQDFFTHVVLGRSLFKRADPDRGRLRALILTALQHHLIDVHRRGPRLRGESVIDPGSLEAISHADTGPNPDRAFSRAWASAVLDEAIRRCRAHFEASGRAGHWSVFEARHLAPVRAGNPTPSYASLRGDHEFRDEAALAAACQVVRLRLRSILEQVVAETCSTAEELRQELAELDEAWGP